MKSKTLNIIYFLLAVFLFIKNASSSIFTKHERMLNTEHLRRMQEKPPNNFNLPIYFVPEEFKSLGLKYLVDNIIEDSQNKLVIELRLNKPLEVHYLNNNIFTELKVTIESHSDKELSVRITDIEEKLFELPHRQPFPFQKAENWNWNYKKIYEFKTAKVGEVFFFQIKRKSTQEIIFDSAGFDFVFSSKYLEITTSMKGERIYGLGDRRYTSFELNTGQFSFWAFDATRIDHGKPGQQIYGHHPMYLRKESKDTYFHTVLFRNTYGMQADYVKNETLTFKVIGGNIDFRFFLGDSNPETAVKMYHRYVNGYTLHPFWVQGFHQSRWGYNGTDLIRKVWEHFNNLTIPIDSLWSDIDYMYRNQVFTFDTQRLSLPLFHEIFDLSKPNGLHWSSIIDSGIAEHSNAGKRGVEQDVFIKSNFTKLPLIGWVWPGRSHFPDFNHPNASKFWEEGLRNITSLYQLEQSGIWLDMNEFTNFLPGEILPNDSNDPPTKNYPFNPCGNRNQLSDFTLSLSATHYSKNDSALFSFEDYQITQYDMHNINGFSEGLATYKAAKNMGKRLPFILSRSTLFGSGQFVQHWTGDNESTWEYLQLSIGLIQSFQLFSIPLVGADICGFNKNTTPELCARWYQVGSLYPFSRNHNSQDNIIDQEPYAFPDHHFVLNSTLRALQVRYQLLKFYYHLFVRGNGTGTVFRPLFFQFPQNQKSYETSYQFMLGEYLMAAPVLQEGDNQTNTTQHTVYFPPQAQFFDFYTYEPQKSENITLTVPFDSLCPLYILSGKIVHIQDYKYHIRSRHINNEFALLIALDSHQESTGQILSIENLNSEQNVQEKCIFQDCVMNIKAQLSSRIEGDFIIRLEFYGQLPTSVFEIFYIYKIVIMGIKHNGELESKVINLKPMWTVKQGATKFEAVFNLEKDE